MEQININIMKMHKQVKNEEKNSYLSIQWISISL